ncbi:MAG TPA: DMT family transporter [Candidatus Limnocylindrales bacterium]|nr:DMT family transporter [Candidatus Limnocylindrales bacterium]
MAPAVFPLVLMAALLHATWNTLLKGSEDPLASATRAVSSSAVLMTPLVVVAWLVAGHPGLPPAGWVLCLVSGALEVVYFVFLSTAYRRGELSVVYPIARGTAPAVAVILGLVVLGEHVRPGELAGVLCLLLGMWAIRRPVGAGRALAPALATGVAIALYSAVDRVGVRLGPPWLYLWGLWLVASAGLVPISIWRERRHPLAQPSWPRAVVIGVLMTVAFFMVLIAYRIAPLVVVAPLRESAIVLVAAWGIWRLREREGTVLKLSGAAAIVAGATLVAIG